MKQKLKYFSYSFFIIFIWSSLVINADSKQDYKNLSPHFTLGDPYGYVRAELIKEGWKPVVSEESDTCINGDVRCTNRPEMESCSGTGVAPCKFVWKKENYILSVFTVGVDATDAGDAAFDSLEINEFFSERN